MSFFRQTTRYPLFFGHPAFAVGVLFFCGLSFFKLSRRPIEALPFWWEFALCAVMVVMVAPMLVFSMLLCSKIAKMHDAVLARQGVVRYADGTSWLDLVVSRECAALVVFAIYIVLHGAHQGESPAHSYAFHRCVAKLDEPGLVYLAKNISDTPTLRELSNACRHAEGVNAKQTPPKPATIAELKLQFGD